LKLAAAQVGDKEAFSEANKKLLDMLREEDEPHLPGVLYHAVGKEVYKVALNMMGAQYKKNRHQMMLKAEQLFRIGGSKKDGNSLFYLGEMHEMGDTVGGISINKAIQCYKSSAALNNPRSLFKLSVL
jgi:TPR repeat protein